MTSLMNESDTLCVLHLPPNLTDEKRDELFKKYGATETKTFRKSNKYTRTLVKFASNEIATKAFLQLHQLVVKGHYLKIDFAKKTIDNESKDFDNVNINDEMTNDKKKKDTVNTEHFQAFIKKLNSWTTNYTFAQPPPPNISYKYPSPTRNTLLRIAIQLIKEPAFYTQVLHLMNRMNLPPPFEELDDEFPTLRQVYDVEKYQNIFGQIVNEHQHSTELINNFGDVVEQQGEEEDDEEESEIETDEDEKIQKIDIIPKKRKISQSKKRLKLSNIVNSSKKLKTTSTSVQKPMRPEEIFEPVCREEPKNLKIELKSIDEQNILNSNKIIAPEDGGGFGLMYPIIDKHDKSQEEPTDSSEKSQEYISSKELAAKRLSPNEQKQFKVFENYHPGVPSCRLYIKNLDKKVQIDDLHYIYKRYVKSDLENSQSQYDVRLMQEGRMKGQAFITFQNVEQAQLALNETNGYELFGKPVVVQFSNKPTKS
ncbi:hypothetical protein HCN44_001385 [Aphidius gifuensis]|uniref:RNA-binding region-containing protein 3 n=1 Tax=Aphidius gifuensis TaxID=684658 RepID=A0A835CT88_APHGI|nr:RNA-binding region-containing protein 3 [Aphidius gifuensis]KAF7992060.1 hypothetical protein HCN44_001385 [Aphidius gifuensis]